MQNVVAINAAAEQGIIAAQATSDEMLLASIAGGGRTAMHTLYSRNNVRVYRFVLRIVRDTTTAEDLVSQVFLDVWRTASQFEGRSGFHLAAVDRPLRADRRAPAPARGHRSGGRLKSPTRPTRPSRWTAAAPAPSCAPAWPSCPRHTAKSSTWFITMESVEEAGAIIGIPQSTVKTRMFYARKQLADLLKGAGVDTLAA